MSVYNYNLIPFNNRLVIYTNHKSNFDPFIIASIFPRPLTFTPKDELYNNFWYGWFLRFCFDATHCIKINRGNNRDNLKSLEKAKEIIKEKLAVLVFPEGGIINSTSDQINSSLMVLIKLLFKTKLIFYRLLVKVFIVCLVNVGLDLKSRIINTSLYFLFIL
uniref:1-acyl-sn-glycerol-3-phosphate acyltransferase n=1 Tax=Candidatus Phytoplasma australasiaticum subsp. australasiaticum TaxID=2832407 RepID=A0A7S7G0S1_9MOLU|nr:1-acyl-sn-glycerol-3-phosphate acyltransferase ['Parthenium hysterophorus' phyllody phytoplasma]